MSDPGRRHARLAGLAPEGSVVACTLRGAGFGGNAMLQEVLCDEELADRDT